MPTQRRLPIVGIGADGWAGLGERARDHLRRAEIILGGTRHLALLPADVAGRRVPWPSPMLPALAGIFDTYADQVVCVLASGDPMFYGIGTILVRIYGADRVEVIPQPSSMSLACARLGWAWQDVTVISLVNRAIGQLVEAVRPGRALLVLSTDGRTPAAVADLLTRQGYGASQLTVLAQLGGPGEHLTTGTAEAWPAGPADSLNVVAIVCADPTPPPESAPPPGSCLSTMAQIPFEAPQPEVSVVPGLPDEAYAHDGQLTKRDVRAVTLARLGPRPGQLLWDVGAGAGSIAIEWLRAEASCRAIAIERRPDRAARIATNAATLGVPALRIVTGAAPTGLAGLPRPDTVFIGGGATVPGVIETCWNALESGGRLVVNAVTLESEQLVVGWRARIGGDLVRIEVSQAAAVGGFTVWRPALPVTQWTVQKP